MPPGQGCCITCPVVVCFLKLLLFWERCDMGTWGPACSTALIVVVEEPSSAWWACGGRELAEF